MKRFLLICISAIMLMALFAGCRDSNVDVSPSPIITMSPSPSASPIISPNVSPDATGDGALGDVEDAVEKGVDDMKNGVDKMMEPSNGANG